MTYWVLSGSVENWDRGVSDSIWGVRENLKGRWDKLEEGDILIFYATRPVSGVIGYGVTESKFKQDKPLWPDEMRENKVIYPYRFEFKTEFVLPKNEWGERKIKGTGLSFQAGLNSQSNEDAINSLFDKVKLKWEAEPVEAPEGKPEEKQEKAANPHEDIKRKLFEIGKIERYISQKEYPMDNRRLDVVWRRVAGSVPTYVFEIELSKGLYRALGKLKHAYDIWNSNIFLVIDEKDRKEVNQLLGGTFHEIGDKITIWDIEKVNELYELQVRDKNLKKELGLL